MVNYHPYAQGQVHDVIEARELLDELIDDIRLKGGEEVIPPKINRREQRLYDKVIYRARNRIERMIGRLKNFRRFTTRFEKMARNFLSMVFLASATLWPIDDTS